MLGNDIIDISKTSKETNWRRRGWLQKVCTPNEIACIEKSKDPFSLVWRMWSMKESAYKIAIQLGQDHALNPTHFETIIYNNKQGLVRYGDVQIRTISNVNKEHISSVAFFGEHIQTEQTLVDFSDNKLLSNSKYLKNKVIEKLRDLYPEHTSDLDIKSSKKRVPKVCLKNNCLDLSISLSHHGRFGSYVISKN